MYPVIRKEEYDFVGQSYASSYPNLHKYPATMIPQIGIKILNELNIKQGKMLDPYCGSGSSFIAGLDGGIKEMHGFDINPIAILISRTKFTKVNVSKVNIYKKRLRNAIYEFIKKEKNLNGLNIPKIYNIDFWFSKIVQQNLAIIKLFIDKIKNKDIKRLFLLPFSETVRECSYTRDHEFKLYKMKSEDILRFNPDVISVYFEKLNKVISIYTMHYLSKLADSKIDINYKSFDGKDNYYDVVLTSPPYGDSRTTVAYGQFSLLSNEWMGIKHARQVDKMLMGGHSEKNLYLDGIIANYISDINKLSRKRALEVSSFYRDLKHSIRQVSNGIKNGGKVIYIVGNRRVKKLQLPTDQFVAEQFERNGLKHSFTYERMLGNKRMPSKNSPTNKKNQRVSTMTQEFIVVCEK